MGLARQRRDAPRRARPASRAASALHPLQTFTRERGPEQLDGAFAAVTAETTRPARSDSGSPARSASSRSPSPTSERDAYHAGAAIASNYLVTLRRAAGSLLEAAGAPPEALDPLMLRTIENGFELTGPIARGDWATVERTSRRSAASAPSSSGCTSRSPRRRRSSREDVRSIAELREALEPLRSGSIGLVPTMGAFHGGHLALFRAAREECDTVVVSLFVNPAQFDEGADLAAYPRDEERDTATAEQAGIDLLFARPPKKSTRPSSRRGSTSPSCRAGSRASTGRDTSAASRRSA